MQGASHDEFERLRRWVEGRDQTAFAGLVRQYVDLVYSAASPRVGQRQLAEDVTQAVFMILSNKAKSIRREQLLTAWLLTTVRYAAANALKMESRRRRHEQEAAPLERARLVSGACSTNPTDVLVWQEIAAELDDAVLKLPAADRRAILMRYFENRPVADVAADLKVTEAAAKQRLHRAIDKLRSRLDRRGASVASIGSAGLATLITTHAMRAAPAGLMHSTCLAVTASGAAAGAGTGISIAKGAIKMMTWTKVKIAAAVVTAVTVGGTGGFIAVQHAMAAERAPSGASGAKPQVDAGVAPNLSKKDNMGIISVADAPPVIVSTSPQAGATDVDASAVTELKVTFSKDMEAGNFSWVQYGKDTFPKTTGKPHFENDKRTCVLPVKLEPGHPYVIWLNQGKFNAFQDTDGHKAVPYLLVFETKK